MKLEPMVDFAPVAVLVEAASWIYLTLRTLALAFDRTMLSIQILSRRLKRLQVKVQRMAGAVEQVEFEALLTVHFDFQITYCQTVKCFCLLLLECLELFSRQIEQPSWKLSQISLLTEVWAHCFGWIDLRCFPIRTEAKIFVRAFSHPLQRSLSYQHFQVYLSL